MEALSFFLTFQLTEGHLGIRKDRGINVELG